MALRGFCGACRCIVGLCGVVGCVVGVSIIREWENSKANPLRKSKKNLTRELKKSYTSVKGELKIL